MGIVWSGRESPYGPDRRRRRRRALHWCRSCYRRAAAPGADACPDCLAVLEQDRAEMASHMASKERRAG